MAKERTYERRAHPRAPGILEGRWSGSTRECRITSLSVSGCFIESQTAMTPGAKVKVEIKLPDQGSVAVVGEVMIDGEVIYVDQSDMGFSIRFLDVTPDDHEKLVRAVDALFAAAVAAQSPNIS